ncbi:WD40-repeat-containing domain protein [Entophlyctis helioformis]|nr:WD40-repeat-containing domain protein [Entophlyctis helioformis]
MSAADAAQQAGGSGGGMAASNAEYSEPATLQQQHHQQQQQPASQRPSLTDGGRQTNPHYIQRPVHGWRLDNFVQPKADLVNADDPRVKDDIIRMIAQYLGDEGFNGSKLTLLDEANVKAFEREERQTEIKRIRKAILDGDWAEVDKLCARSVLRNNKSFIYAAYKQQYLEYIEHHEIQKAFTHLNKRLKPLEHLQTTPNEFKDLCYLLTAKSVHDVPSFRNWDGIVPAREKLAELFQSMIDYDDGDREGSVYVPPNRLLKLMRQAVAYQVEMSRYHPSITPKLSTLLHDYTPLVVPNAVKTVFRGHTGNVKCVEFVGEDGRLIVSGSSDNTCRVWETETGAAVGVLEGHSSRIWDMSSTLDGSFVASASGDSTVKLWSLKESTMPCVSTLQGGSGDVYTVKYHPTGAFLATGGYDKVVRLYDVERGVVAKTFTGHQLSIPKVIFSPLGNLIISGSKDNTIKFWDIVSGLCIKTISSHLGEVTCVEMNADGTMLLSSSKDNSNRLWDIRMLRPIRKFKGHQNTSKNFIRASFAGESLIVGGSEDGAVYVWDRDKGGVLQRLRGGHAGIVYSVAWNARQALFASCAEDHSLCTWWYRPPASDAAPAASASSTGAPPTLE